MRALTNRYSQSHFCREAIMRSDLKGVPPLCRYAIKQTWNSSLKVTGGIDDVYGLR